MTDKYPIRVYARSPWNNYQLLEPVNRDDWPVLECNGGLVESRGDRILCGISRYPIAVACGNRATFRIANATRWS